jgi:FMN phosphatase YigB (HAD superfamily)
MLKRINSYSAITIFPRSLVVFDIDDTLLNFPLYNRKWWVERKAEYGKIMGEKEADQRTLEDWRAAISTIDPVAIDKDGFHDFCQRAVAEECGIIYLTARSAHLAEITRRHLKNSLDLDADHLYYAEDKGPALVALLQKHSGYDRVIFVDDYVKNHDSVRLALDTLSVPVDTYHFQMM